jgi:hypothetical protein
MARLRLGAPSLGFAVGGGIGALSDHVDQRGLYRAQASVWKTFAVDQLFADASFIGTTASLVESTRYVDLSTSWRRVHQWLEIGATAGVRAGFTNAATGGWGSADAAAWLAPNLAVVAAIGRALDDVPRGVPRTQYASITLRIAARGHASVTASDPPVDAPRTVVTRAGVIVRVDSASTVELMADFTEWAGVALERSGKEWRLDRVVPPGLHRLAIRVNGGEWIAPPGLPRAADDLGGVVGLITVP